MRKKYFKIGILVITILFGVSMAIFTIIYFTMPTYSSYVLIRPEFFFVIIIIFVFIYLIVCLDYYTKKSTRKYFKEKGIRGTATLLSIKRSSGFTRPDYSRFKLKFRIDIPIEGIEPYIITRSIEMMTIMPGLFKIGSQYTALVDPNKLNRVKIRAIDKNF